jgi:hypothetical protein
MQNSIPICGAILKRRAGHLSRALKVQEIEALQLPRLHATLEKLLSSTAMKRVVLPLIGGVLIPPVYAGVVLIIVSVVTLITTSAPFDSKWYWLLCLPLEWSGHLYNHFFPAEAEKNLGELRVQVFLVNLITDFLVNCLLTYLFLWFRRKRGPGTFDDC